MLRLPRFRKLHVFFTGPFAMVGLVSVLVVSFIAIRSARKLLEKMAQDLVADSMAHVSFRVEQVRKSPIEIFDYVLAILDLTPLEQDFDLNWTRLFQNILEKHPEISSISFAYSDGGLFKLQRSKDNQYRLIRTPTKAAGNLEFIDFTKKWSPDLNGISGEFYDVRREDWFAQLRDHGQQLPYEFGKSSEPYLTWTFPLLTKDGKLRFVIRIDSALRDLEAFLKASAGHGTSKVFVVDQKGLLLASSFNASPFEVTHQKFVPINGFNHPDCLIRCSMRQVQDQIGSLETLSGRHTMIASGDSGPLHVAVTKLSYDQVADLIIFSVIPEATYMSYIRDVIHDVFWVTLGILIFLTLAGYIVSLRVTSPILELNESLKLVGKGDWEKLTPLDRDDEIGELSQSFYKMSMKLRDLVRNLEGLVQARTVDLSELLDKYARANHELERTNATKDRFFSIIAHDLKSPFNALKGYSGIIEDSFDSLDREQLRSMVNRISVSSEEAYGLLENLLQWALIQSGGIRVKWEVFDLREVVLEVIDLLRVNAKVKNVSLRNQIADPIWIEADRNMVATVLRNLISNSIKFTQAEAGHVLIQAETKQKMVEVSIEDNGIGINPDNLQKLFRKDIYFSERGTGNEAGTGQGLGLCYEFVTMNRGQIKVESAVNHGTKFKTLWLGARTPQESHLELVHGPLKILFVDDSIDSHNLVGIFLKEKPWNLSFANSGQEALMAINSNNFDIILMDLNMPGMDGIETTKRIRDEEMKRHLKQAHIIAFTSSVLQTDIDAAIKAGCDSYLVKPIKKQKLIYAISRFERK